MAFGMRGAGPRVRPPTLVEVQFYQRMKQALSVCYPDSIDEGGDMKRITFLLLGVALIGCDDAGVTVDPEVDAGPDDATVTMPDAFAGDANLPPKDGGGPDPDLGPIRDAAIPPVPVIAIETRINAGTTAAGLDNLVTCVALDENGDSVEGHSLTVDVRPIDGWGRDEMDRNLLIGETTGVYQVTCIASQLGLRDPSPARWEVVPGRPVRAATVVDPAVIEAGGSSAVDCYAWDDYGNRIELGPAVDISTLPDAAGVIAAEGNISATAAGRYQVNCEIEGADGPPAELAVLPGPPARLVTAVTPVQPIYNVGQVVTYAARVLDAHNNTVPDAPLVWDAGPPLPGFGEGRFRPLAEGRYTLTVDVLDTDLHAETEIVVDAGGPAVTCTDPPLGAMVPDGPLTLRGRASDLVGIERLTIDGDVVEVAEDGQFSLRVNPEWGLNVHELVAEDAAGNVNSVFCAYFASRYVAEAGTANDTIQLHLTQNAIDDGAGDRPIRSVADLLRRMLNSQALIDTVVDSVQNPVVPNQCRVRVPVIGTCLTRLGANFEGLRIHGARTIDIDLVNGGFRLRARLNNIDVDVRLTGTFTNRGTINAEYISVDVTFDVSLRNGRPDVRVRGNPRTGIGDLDADFDGIISGTLLNLVFEAFEGTIRDEIAGAISGFVTGEADTLVQGVLNGLDLASLALALDVPGIAGGPETPLSLAVDFSSLNVTPQRMLIGIGSRVNGPTRQAAASAGVPQPPGNRAVAMNPDGNAAAGINLLLVNQLLHRLWRAGVFHFANAGELLGGLPDGARFGLQVLIPPAVIGTGGGGVRMHLGPAVAEVAYPGLFDDPLALQIAAWIDAEVVLNNGTDISFENLTVTDLALSIDDSDITPEARATLEREFTRIIQALVDGALSGALPSLPVPDFALPDSLSTYGIPRGTRLGLRNLSLDGSASHFILDGDLRE